MQGLFIDEKRPIRIAVYCRVSTESTQEGSLESQRDYFIAEIDNHSNWSLAKIYADRAKTGTQIKGRTEFQRMMRHASEHRFDYIVTKSISRFSRNVADMLKCIKELNDLGIGVYFMEQGFDSFAQDSGFILSLLASIAQEEAESVSENIKMTFKEHNARGTPARKCCYGYHKECGAWMINHDEAIRVKLGFLMMASGYSYIEIARRLNKLEDRDKTDRRWDSAMVSRMLKNEAYIGDIMTNKMVAVRDESGKRMVVNDGISDKFYIEDHHEPIVGRLLFDKVNEMLKAGGLAGQDNFKGIDDISGIAKRDHLLDEVRRLLPQAPGRWIQYIARKEHADN